MQQGGQPQQRRPYRDVLDALSERVRPFIERQPDFAQPAYGSVLQSGADMLPGVGDVVGVEDLQAAARDGDPVGIGLGLLAAIPGIPAIGRGSRGSRRAGGLIADAAPASRALREAGVPGIRYLDAASRGVGEGSRNYVVFNDELVKILRKYGISGLGLGLGANALSGQQTEPGPNALSGPEVPYQGNALAL